MAMLLALREHAPHHSRHCSRMTQPFRNRKDVGRRWRAWSARRAGSALDHLEGHVQAQGEYQEGEDQEEAEEHGTNLVKARPLPLVRR